MARKSKRKLLQFLPATLVFLFLFLFLAQFNEMLKESYQIEQNLQQISRLARENELLELKLLENNRLQNIELLAFQFNFEKVGRVHYLQPRTETVVAK